MNAPNPRVLDLIQKLRNLSEDAGATEAEATLAAEKMQALMTEHNLSMAQVEAAGGTASDSRIKEGVNHRQVYNWQKRLMRQIAELNFCHCAERYQARNGAYGARTSVFQGYQLVGRSANVASTQVMFEYLVQAIGRLAKERVSKGDYFTRYGHSFKEGCADRLIERLQAKRREEVEEQERRRREQEVRSRHPGAATTNALVVSLSDYVQDEIDLNNDVRQGWEPGTTKRRRDEYKQREEALKHQREAERMARRAQLLHDNPDLINDPDRLFYLEQGYSAEMVDKWLKPETDAQRRKREAREERQQRAQWERIHRAHQRERDRLNRDGYEAGMEAGDDISLDRQVDATQRAALR